MSPPHKHSRMNRVVRKEKREKKENEIKELTDSTKHAYDVLWPAKRVQHLWFTGVRAVLQSPALAGLSWHGQVETRRNKDRKTHQGGSGTHRLQSKTKWASMLYTVYIGRYLKLIYMDNFWGNILSFDLCNLIILCCSWYICDINCGVFFKSKDWNSIFL